MSKEITIDQKNIFFRKNESMGTIEAVDAVSGTVVAVQNQLTENFQLGMYQELIKASIDGKEVYFQPGIVAERYKLPTLSFNKPIADLIIQSIMEGEKTLKEACKLHGVQYSTVMKWAKDSKDFAESLDEARRLSAEMIHDDIYAEARDMMKGNLTKGELESKRAALDLLKWSAEKRDPNRFGNKQEKAAQGAVQILIQTGISRENTIVEIKDEQAIRESSPG